MITNYTKEQIKEHVNVENISEQEMLNLFKVEELENRLEMAAINLVDAAIDGNKVCWLG